MDSPPAPTVAKKSWETLWRNWDFIWALKCESSLDWQIREKTKSKDVFLSSSATRGLYPGVLVGYTAKIEASSWVNSGLHGVILLSICHWHTTNIWETSHLVPWLWKKLWKRSICSPQVTRLLLELTHNAYNMHCKN